MGPDHPSSSFVDKAEHQGRDKGKANEAPSNTDKRMLKPEHGRRKENNASDGEGEESYQSRDTTSACRSVAADVRAKLSRPKASSMHTSQAPRPGIRRDDSSSDDQLEGDVPLPTMKSQTTSAAAIATSVREKLSRRLGPPGPSPDQVRCSTPSREPMSASSSDAESSPRSPARKTGRQRHEDAADTSEGDWHESLSIAETNRLRARLGLRPLDTGPTLNRVQVQRRSQVPQRTNLKAEDVGMSEQDATGEANKLHSDHNEGDSDMSSAPRPGPRMNEMELEEVQWNEVLSIEGTNQLRAKLGLKPLDVPTGADAASEPSAEAKEEMKWIPAKGREGSRVSTLSTFDFQFHHKKGHRGDEEGSDEEFKEGEWHASLSIAATNVLRLKLGLRPLDTPAESQTIHHAEDREAFAGHDHSQWMPRRPHGEPDRPISKFVRKRKKSPPPPTKSFRLSASVDAASAAVHDHSTQRAAPDNIPSRPMPTSSAASSTSGRFLSSLPPKVGTSATSTPSRFLACLPPKAEPEMCHTLQHN
eukprot:GGOE01019754.1.p1 GENE.GGOE01019754.1~~GGOE01019754.1.p1  ORF type:complete len:550 (+),score=60.45 GGOE01019754.1:55-1650(+)